MTAHSRPVRRRGNVLVLCAFLMVGLLAMIAFAVDLGVIMVARDQLQRTADASALAATWELVDENGPAGGTSPLTLSTNARQFATQYAALNPVLTQSPALADSDVVVGYMDPWDANPQLLSVGTGQPNAVRVRVRRTAQQNGDIPLFFARVLGIDRASAEAEATAVLVNSISGFRTPSDGSNLDILPFALDEYSWNRLVENDIGADGWGYDASTKTISKGGDGIKEVNLYPQGTGSPGNRGTVDIGGADNSTSDICRQILYGISPKDLSYHGGELRFNESGVLPLNGDTGISAGVEAELIAIRGQPRIIPIFRSVESPGNNATYTIVRFVGVRVMNVSLTGSMANKRVIIQPCTVVSRGGIPANGEPLSTFVYSPVWLIR